MADSSGVPLPTTTKLAGESDPAYVKRLVESFMARMGEDEGAGGLITAGAGDDSEGEAEEDVAKLLQKEEVEVHVETEKQRRRRQARQRRKEQLLRAWAFVRKVAAAGARRVVQAIPMYETCTLAGVYLDGPDDRARVTTVRVSRRGDPRVEESHDSAVIGRLLDARWALERPATAYRQKVLHEMEVVFVIEDPIWGRYEELPFRVDRLWVAPTPEKGVEDTRWFFALQDRGHCAFYATLYMLWRGTRKLRRRSALATQPEAGQSLGQRLTAMTAQSSGMLPDRADRHGSDGGMNLAARREELLEMVTDGGRRKKRGAKGKKVGASG